MRSFRRLAAVLACTLLAVGLVACGDDPVTTADLPTTNAAGALHGEIDVFAAASLTEAFGDLGERFEAAHPGTKVNLNFGASSALAEQVVQGAPADVFASADEANMDKVDAAGLTSGSPQVFAENALTILVATGNPKDVKQLDDLASPDLAVVLCAAEVPCGRYAEQILGQAEVAVTPRSLEENVKGVVTKVTTGEADAGIVYVTDAKAAGDEADRVAIPEDQNAVATYPISTLTSAPNPAVAKAFVGLVTGGEGRAVLSSYGFTLP
jgi:molybdate transport system substrate-binding protein